MSELHYWPWWGGALGLFAVTIGYFRLAGRPFGISGAWSRVVFARDEAQAAEAEAKMGTDARAIEDALIKATLEEFGPEAAAALEAERKVKLSPTTNAATLSVRHPWTESLALLLGIALGGALSALLAGHFDVTFDLGSEFRRLFGGGWTGPAALVAGGMLVGFGTQMAGGCTSGHGLSGCSRFQVGSLVATATFFGTAVVIATLLEHVTR